jgi:hypothetical protein
LIPVIKIPDGSHIEITADNIKAMKEFLRKNRKIRGNLRREFDIIKDGMTPPNQRQARKIVEPLTEAGATWWIETMWEAKGYEVLRRISSGPPIL